MTTETVAAPVVQVHDAVWEARNAGHSPDDVRAFVETALADFDDDQADDDEAEAERCAHIVSAFAGPVSE